MRPRHAACPRQPDGEHRRTLAKAALLKLAGPRSVYGTFVRLVERQGDLDERLHATIAGFPDDRLLEQVVFVPSHPDLSGDIQRRLIATLTAIAAGV